MGRLGLELDLLELIVAAYGRVGSSPPARTPGRGPPRHRSSPHQARLLLTRPATVHPWPADPTVTPLWADRQRTATVLPAVVGERVLVGDGTSVRLLDVRDGTEVSRWSLLEALVGGDGQWQAFVAAGADRFLLRCGARTLWQVPKSWGSLARRVASCVQVTR
ncbi:hypothetical protein AB0B57_34740 [Micromonospora sp. NPDC049101]|uniref:hypothetical protein n=1 Tax=unclassified Micromonospora TaxID=2617518 RepID=UPI0033CBF09D